MKKTFFKAGAVFVALACVSPLIAQNGTSGDAAQAGFLEDSEKKEKKNYTGWIDTSAKELNVKNGIVQIRVKPTLGTFSFAVLNDNDKYVPVLSTANEYTSSGFYLKAGKKRYRLLSDKKVKPSVAKIPSGFRLNYDVAKTASVSLDLEAVKSLPESDTDMIKVTAEVKNLGQKSDDFALRAVLDTVLGETYEYHFYANDNTPIKNEVLYRSTNIKEQPWIYSRNSNASMQVLFDGADITEPEIVALANYATLEKASWEPDMAVYRAFDTVLAYKNSAIGINWNSVRLRPEQSAQFVFYIALAADGALPQGAAFVKGKEPAAPALPVQEPEFVGGVTDDEKALPPEEPKLTIASDEFAVRKEVPVPTVPFNVNNLSKEQLTLEYVQNLIDRISALEENSTSVNRKEILQLNAELDAILSVLRQ